MQSVGLLQSAIEGYGIPTVALTFETADPVAMSRALSVRFPYGAPFGNPLNRWLQARVLGEALALLEEEPTLRASAYRWRQTREKVAW